MEEWQVPVKIELLSEHMFSKDDIDEMLRLREKNKNKGLIDQRRMSEIMLKAREDAKIENEKNKQNDINMEAEEKKESQRIGESTANNQTHNGDKKKEKNNNSSNDSNNNAQQNKDKISHC